MNTIEDETTPNDGKCSLREAIQNANDNNQTSLTSPDCKAGSATQVDRVIFSLSNKTIVVGEHLPDISDPSGLTIDGRGSKITISGEDSVRVFAVSAGAKLALKNLTVAHGKAGPFGGGAYNDVNGTLIVDHSTFSNNSSDFDGGGIFNATGATLKVTNSTISDNSAPQGGGVYNAGGMLTVTNSTLSGNSAVGFDSSSPGFGGGMINDAGGTAEVTNSTFSNNSTATTSGLGGGIHNEATLKVTNSTLSGNNLGGNTGGSAGISNLSTLLTVTSSTFSNNGIGNQNAATLSNTILANVPSGDNCSGTITDEGYNISDDDSCNFDESTSTSRNDTGPKLDPDGLKNNGGPTQTIALLKGSPAINAIPKGTNGCGTEITKDQRGVKRPQGTRCDIGSYEKVKK